MALRSVVMLGLAVLVACGRPTASVEMDASPDSAAGPPVTDKLYVAGATGLSVVDVAAGSVVREMPAGVSSPDWSTHYVAEADGPSTVVRALSLASGAELKRTVLPGAFAVPSEYGPRADALSANGSFLVLSGHDDAKSRFVVIDTSSMRETQRVELLGRFTFDAIDDSGRSLYLLEHPRADSHLYNVRLVDLPTGILQPNAIVDQKATSPSAEHLRRGTMGGIYHASATAAGVHFGFYTHPSKGPVIHSLNLSQRWARCLIDLADRPTHKAQWAIATSPKEELLYAVNPATGTFASVRTRDLSVTVRPLSVDGALETEIRGSVAVSADGTRLYAAGGKGILVIDPRAATLKSQYLRDRVFVSVMVSRDGTRLYALDTHGAISRIEPSTGRDLGVVARLPAAVGLVRID